MESWDQKFCDCKTDPNNICCPLPYLRRLFLCIFQLSALVNSFWLQKVFLTYLAFLQKLFRLRTHYSSVMPKAQYCLSSGKQTPFPGLLWVAVWDCCWGRSHTLTWADCPSPPGDQHSFSMETAGDGAPDSSTQGAKSWQPQPWHSLQHTLWSLPDTGKEGTTADYRALWTAVVGIRDSILAKHLICLVPTLLFRQLLLATVTDRI